MFSFFKPFRFEAAYFVFILLIKQFKNGDHQKATVFTAVDRALV